MTKFSAFKFLSAFPWNFGTQLQSPLSYDIYTLHKTSTFHLWDLCQIQTDIKYRNKNAAKSEKKHKKGGTQHYSEIY